MAALSEQGRQVGAEDVPMQTAPKMRTSRLLRHLTAMGQHGALSHLGGEVGPTPLRAFTTASAPAAADTAAPFKSLVCIGGLGTMLGPASTHLSGPDSPAKVLRVHDRGSGGTARDETRAAWTAHGATLHDSLGETLAADAEAAVVCVGKNGDDASIIAAVAKVWQGTGRALLHLSTVSPAFAEAAHAHCAEHGVRYVCWPLTGGALGAQQGTMLILAGGDEEVYARSLPVLEALGNPRFFGASHTAGAEVKLIGHMLSFNNLNGLFTAAGARTLATGGGIRFGADPELADFFEFMMGGVRCNAFTFCVSLT
eukprot:COSAG04_NODE_2522_length_3977_cov_1.450748_2_plen_312_part_00